MGLLNFIVDESKILTAHWRTKRSHLSFRVEARSNAVGEERIRRASSMENKLRLLGISTLAGLGLSISSASAADMKLSGWDIQSSLTGSAGISVRISDREQSLVSTANGGPANTAANVGLLSATAAGSSA